MKYYAVKKGRTPGVYRTWEDAKKQVAGFSGAEYKSFEKITDATEYLDWNKETQPDIVKEDSLSNAIKKIQAAKIVPQAKKKKIKKTSSNNPADYFATIYTDGGSRNTGVHKGGHVNKTDKAAWAYLIEWQDGRTYGSGGEFGATNNKMELLGLINALEKLLELKFNDKHLLFVLDSQYVLNGINKHWIEGWKKRGWKRANGSLINASEWKKLDSLLGHFSDSTFSWTKGHADNEGNVFVDHELNRYMDKMK